jgi:hypothetical protein
VIKFDGYDEAIIGPATIWRDQKMIDVLVYDAEIIRGILINKDGIKPEDAREFIEFNLEGGYLGEGTPILVWTQDEWGEAE